MSSGRSPYPTRSRRRQQALQQQQQHHQHQHQPQQHQQHQHQHANGDVSTDIDLALDSSSTSFASSPRHSLGSMSTVTNTSQYRLGQSLVQARLSPRITSPNSNSNATRRFFDGNTATGTNAHTHTPKPAAAMERESQVTSTIPTSSTSAAASAASATSATTGTIIATTAATGTAPAPTSLSSSTGSIAQATPNSTSPTAKQLIMDGINITHLRLLAAQTLAHAHSASSPSMATFFASLVYAKTQAPEDALLYAQALLQSQESPKRCVRLLEQAGLFQYTYTHTSTYTNTQKQADHKSSNNNNIPLALRIEAVLVATQALATLEDWPAVLTLLEDAHLYATIRAAPQESPLLNVQPLEDEDDIAWKAMVDAFQVNSQSATTIHPLSRLCCMRAQAYAETGHPLRAATYYQRALRIDPQCVQALDGLLNDQLVQPQQALELIWTLNISQEWLRALYLARVHVAAPTTTATMPDPLEISSTQNKSLSEDPFWNDDSSLQLLTPIMPSKPRDDDAMMGSGPNGRSRGHVDAHQLEVQGALDRLLGEFKLEQSSHVLAMAAQRAYRQSQLPLALKYCQELARVDPLCTTAAYVHVATLVALGHKRTLFRLAHEWVDAAPKSARAWFAVGSYYFACEKYHVAQRHFCRATRLNPQVVEAWIAFGASFAACDESDQALASFRAAQRLAPGDPTSLLYIGMEYLRTNHLSLAEHFLLAAHQSSQGSNRLCLNELGVWHLHEKNYETAALWFVRTLSGVDTLDAAKQVLETGLTTLLDAIQDAYWEPTVFNLAQTLRKLRMYDSAIHCLERCLTLKPTNPSAWTALGFCHHLDGNIDKAIDVYHQALAQKPEDPFASEMLQRALQDALQDTTELMEELDLGPTKLQGFHNNNNNKGARQSMESASYMTDDGLSLSVASGDVDMG